MDPFELPSPSRAAVLLRVLAAIAFAAGLAALGLLLSPSSAHADVLPRPLEPVVAAVVPASTAAPVAQLATSLDPVVSVLSDASVDTVASVASGAESAAPSAAITQLPSALANSATSIVPAALHDAGRALSQTVATVTSTVAGTIGFAASGGVTIARLTSSTNSATVTVSTGRAASATAPAPPIATSASDSHRPVPIPLGAAAAGTASAASATSGSPVVESSAADAGAPLQRDLPGGAPNEFPPPSPTYPSDSTPD